MILQACWSKIIKSKKVRGDLIVSRQSFKDAEELLAKLEHELNEKKELKKSVSEKSKR